jgi:hypothetical protein
VNAERGSSVMTTYKLGPVTQSDGAPSTYRRPLLCEACSESLGNVPSAAELHGIPARLVAARWPEMKGVVERHDASCPGKGEAAE